MVATSVHAQVLGASFERLPALLRGVHDARPRKEFSGRCSVESGRNWLARAIALFASLPRRSHDDVAVHVVIERSDGRETSELRETWTRQFGEQRMRSIIRHGRDGLEECFGPIVLTFGLTAEPDRIVWRLEGARFLFVPLPTALFAGCGAFETIVNGRYYFDARAGIAGIGLLVHYKGWLTEHGERVIPRDFPGQQCCPSVIVFDGVCVLCSRWVDFVLRRDLHGRYKFAAMQTASGRALLIEHGIDPDDPLSFLLLEGEKGYTDTDAIVRILRSFGPACKFVALLVSIVPRFIRDPLYRWMARHRYRIFGQRSACRVPTADIADRFLP